MNKAEFKSKSIIKKIEYLPLGYKIELIGRFLIAILAAATAACTTIAIYSGITQDVYNIRILIGSAFGIIFSAGWMKYEDYLFKYIKVSMIIECLLYAGLFVYIIMTLDYNTYMLLSIAIGSLVSNIVYPGQNRIHTAITKDEIARNAYADISGIIGSVGVILGTVFALIINWDIRIAFMVLFPTLIIDDLTSYIQYRILEKEGKIINNKIIIENEEQVI